MRKYFVSSAVVLLFNGCYLGKTLEQEVHVSVLDVFDVTINNNGNSNFSAMNSHEQYRNTFIAGMKNELQSSKIIADGVNPSYEISITSFVITESTFSETVNDADSPDNGKVFELTKLELEAGGIVRNIASGKTKTWMASKDKSEKVTNSRSAGQVITGQNKDRNVYREKEFDQAEVDDLSQSTGRRSAVSMTKIISKDQK